MDESSVGLFDLYDESGAYCGVINLENIRRREEYRGRKEGKKTNTIKMKVDQGDTLEFPNS